MAKEIITTMNIQLTLIETGTEEQYRSLEERIGFLGGIGGFKKALAEEVADALRNDGALEADDVVISDVKVFFNDVDAEVVE